MTPETPSNEQPMERRYVRREIEDAILEGRNGEKFDLIMAAAHVEHLINQERKVAVQHAFELLRKQETPDTDNVLLEMFPPLT